MPELFAAQAARSPDAVAVVFEDAQLTYAQLDARANQLAHHLQSLGVGPEVVVGLCVERSLEMMVGLLGILKAGGAYLPLDPAYPPERLAFMLEDRGRGAAHPVGACATPCRASRRNRCIWTPIGPRSRDSPQRAAHASAAQHRLRHLHLRIDRHPKGVPLRTEASPTTSAGQFNIIDCVWGRERRYLRHLHLTPQSRA